MKVGATARKKNGRKGTPARNAESIIFQNLKNAVVSLLFTETRREMSPKEFLAAAKSSIKSLFTLLCGNKQEQLEQKDVKMFSENIENAYRFCFGRPAEGSRNYNKTWYDFKPEQIADFISKIIEKEDRHRVKFTGRKNVEYKTVSQMVSPRSGGASRVEWNENSFPYLYRHPNVQNLRNMFSILAYRKIPITIFGKQYLVEYDNGADFKEFATDEQFIDQACYLKELNSGEMKVCKDFLRFRAI